MDTYFLFFACCFIVPVYSFNPGELEVELSEYEEALRLNWPKQNRQDSLNDKDFIKYSNGNERIECDSTSFIVMNDAKHYCNEKESCRINSTRSVYYVCLKKTYEESNCIKLTNDMLFNKPGCYIGVGSSTYVTLPNKGSHLFGLYMNNSFYDETNWTKFKNVFYYNFKRKVKLSIRKNAWMLIKVSNKEEDFTEFFMDEKSRSTAGPTEKASNKEEDFTEFFRHAIPRSNAVPTEKASNKEGFTESTTDEKSRSNAMPTEKVIIIAAAILIVLLLIFLIAAVIYYRRRRGQDLNRSKSIQVTNVVNESPRRRNNEINTMFYENPVSNRDNVNVHDNEISYATIRPDCQSPQKRERQQPAQVNDVVYAELDLGEGLKNDTAPVGPCSAVMDTEPATTAPRHIEVNGELYATVTKNEESIYANSFFSI